MAKKSGPKKGSKQRRKDPAQNGAERGSAATSEKSAGQRGTAYSPEAPQRADASGRESKNKSTGARLGALFNSPAVRKVMAATLVSAAGALLFNKRGGEKDREPSADDMVTSTTQPPARGSETRSAKRTGASSRKPRAGAAAPASDPIDPLVAAGVAGELGKKKRSGGSTPRRKAAKPAATTSSSLAEPSTVDAGPGAYPDGSPVGDTAGRTSVEGGPDRTQ